MATRLWVKPLGDRIVVMSAQLEESVEEMFIAPGESAKEQPQQAQILAVGLEVTNGELLPGVTILHARYAGTEITIEGKTVLILFEKECMAILERQEVEDAEEDRPRLKLKTETVDWPAKLAAQSLLSCGDHSHGDAIVWATHIATGPHGRLPYCQEHAEAYRKVMVEQGYEVEVVPIEHPATHTE